MSKVLITGVDGFTGRYLAALLADQGDEVVGISHRPLSIPVNGLSRSYVCDLTDADGLKDILSDVRPQKVAHLAAIAFVSHGIIEDIYRTNIVGTRNVLQALSDVDSAEAVLLASSANVYGNRVAGAIDEGVLPDPINDYAISKLSMEYVANLYKSVIPITIARPFNYTGIGQSINFVIPKIVDHALRREHKIELGNLDVFRDFSDVRDVVYTYSCLLNTSESINGTFNISSGKAYSLREVIGLIQEISGHIFDVHVNPAFVRQNEVKMLWGDRSKIDSVCGPNKFRGLRETLSWMINK